MAYWGTPSASLLTFISEAYQTLASGANADVAIPAGATHFAVLADLTGGAAYADALVLLLNIAEADVGNQYILGSMMVPGVPAEIIPAGDAGHAMTHVRLSNGGGLGANIKFWVRFYQ